MELYEAKFSYTPNNGEKQKKVTEIWMIDAVNNGEAEQHVVEEMGQYTSDLKVKGVRASGMEIGNVVNPSGKDDKNYDADENYSWYTVTIAMEMEDNKVTKARHLVRALSASEAIELAEGEYSVGVFSTVEVKRTIITKVLPYEAKA